MSWRGDAPQETRRLVTIELYPPVPTRRIVAYESESPEHAFVGAELRADVVERFEVFQLAENAVAWALNEAGWGRRVGSTIAVDLAGFARRARPEPARVRDATAGELAQEPESVLQALAEGSLLATEETRWLARQELDARRLRR